MTADGLPPELSPRMSRRRPRRRPGAVLATVVAAAGAAGILATATVGYAGLSYTDSQVHRAPAGVLTAKGVSPHKYVSKSMNILIVGSDSRVGLSRKEQAALHVGSEKSAEGQRSDVTMLLHIGAGAQKAELLSFPRDSWVMIPEHQDENGRLVPAHHAKINDAYHDGGGALTVRTVQDLTGIKIDHYVEVNFLGFVKMVNAVNGVDVCTPRALKDSKSGLDIPAGVTHLDAPMALKYARARHLVGNDFARIGRQQKLIGAIVKKSTTSGVLTNPGSLSRLVRAGVSALTLDRSFGRTEIVELAKQMRSLTPSNLVFVDLPVANPDYRPPGTKISAVKLDDAASHVIYDKILHDTQVGPQAKPSATATPTPTTPPLTKAPAAVRVRVLNGSGVVGMGKKGAADLGAVGFTVIGKARNATQTGLTTTTIRADPTYAEALKTLQAALPEAEVEQVPGQGRTFEVVIGSAYTGALQVPAPIVASRPSASPTPSAKPRTAADDPCT